ncbi:Ig-like domain-containing protein [Candidatus Marinimicrobia bacterium]|nr:Ig-like domain-containing protein [Candidatus Neomarinimicrobiota bacterium]
MRKFWLLLSILFIWTCGGGGGSSPTEPEVPPIVINLTSLDGQAQKGPFNNGTAINIAELTNTLSPTGRNFSSAITDNTGRFAVANVQLESPYVELRANGFYFNEVSNEISDAQLTLFAISNLTGKTSLNVNILTHLEKNRMVTLMSGDSPKTFAQAKLQAQEEVFAIFDYSRANVPESELLDISQGGAANGKLLAMSAILQGDLTVGQMSQLLANISTDIASDGTLDDTNLRNTLIENSKNLDMAEVRSNLVAHYSSLGISATIPDFETEINQFLKPPVSQDMSASTAEDTAINITLAGSDPEGESLTYTILEVNNATVTLSGNVANYAPDANFNGTDTFTYYANDGTSDSNIATVTMTVSSEDDEPNTNDVATTTDEDVAVAINLTADEYDGQNYSFSIITDVSNGTTSLSGSVVTYTPNQDWNGTDTFTFEATDDRTARTNVATATITVNPVNDAPIANDVTTSTDENLFNRNNTNIDITYDADNDILFNNNIKGTSSFGNSNSVDITLDGTDIDGDNLTYSVVATNNGTITISGSTATYEPTQDWNGEDTFTYTANDGSLDSNTATVTITVNSINDIPVVYDASVSGDEDATSSPPTGSSIDGFKFILPEATDVESGSSDDFHKSLEIVTLPTHGKIYSNNNTGDDSRGNELSVGSAMNNIEDGYGARIWYVQDTEHWNGTDTFTYKANDGTLDSNTATVTITVNSINDIPKVTDFSKSTNEDSPVTFSVHDYITDPDGDNTYWSYFVGLHPTKGTVTIEDSNNGNYTYTPNENFNGSDSFIWYINDSGNGPGAGITNGATTTITVNPVDDLPVAIDLSASTAEDNSVEISLQYYDAEGDVWSNPSYNHGNATNGDVTLNTTGDNPGTIAIYTPNSGYFGTDSFTYSATGTSSVEGVVTVEVSEVVGDLTTFPDLTEGYSERFSDIVYDNSTGGYIVAGYSHQKNDSSGPPWNGGGTWNMFKLSVDSFMDTQVYEHLDFQSSVIMYNEKQNSIHGFDISRVSHNGSYLLSSGGDYLWSVDSDGSSVFSERINQISGYSGIENISNTFQLPSGNFIILASMRLNNDTSGQKFPIIAEIDQNLSLQNYKILDNHVTDSSLKYDSYYNRMVYNHNDGIVYVIAQTNIIGFNNSNQLNYYEVGLPDATASNTFTVNRYENLSDISGSPTQMYIQGENSDVMTYKRNPNGYDEFVLMTEEDSTDQLMLVYYRLMDNGSKEIVDTFYPNHSGSHDFMEFVDSGNRYYLVAQEDNDIRVQSVFDTENFGTQFDKLIDITGLGYQDKLGGATATNFYNNGSGIAITGSIRKDSSEDWDGFILLLDINGNRIY